MTKIHRFYIILVVVCILTGFFVVKADYSVKMDKSSVFSDINRIANSFEEYNEKRF